MIYKGLRGRQLSYSHDIPDTLLLVHLPTFLAGPEVIFRILNVIISSLYFFFFAVKFSDRYLTKLVLAVKKY